MTAKKNIDNFNDTSSIIIVGKGVLISLLISALCIVLYGLILTLTELTESSMPTVILIISIVSIALAAIYVAMKVESKGWLHGAITGLLYMVILLLLSLLFKTGISIGKFIIFRVLMGFVVGALAGIIGINLK